MGMLGAVASRVGLAVCVTMGAGACGAGGAGHAQSASSAAVKPGATARAVPTATATRSRRPGRSVRMLSQRELEQVVIGPKDVPGWKTSTVLGRGGDGLRIPVTISDVSKWPRIGRAACEPLYDMTMLASRHQFYAVVRQSVRTGSGEDEKSTEMSLTSLHVADAPKVIEDLETSLRTCSSFKSLEPGESWSDPVPLADPMLGDQAVAYRITDSVPSVNSRGEEDGGPPTKAPFNYVVVRSGATIAAFYSMGYPKDTQPPQVPMNVVMAQVDKLDRVG